MPTEHVLVVPTEVFHRLGHFQGFTADVHRYLPQLLNPAHVSYQPRDKMETDPSYKQLIPYVIFRHVLGPSVRVFAYTRGTGQGEGRLHKKRSIGVGGHISTADLAGDSSPDLAESPYRLGMQRELAEEVVIDTAYTERLVGLINDDETEVGRVHLGLVHVCECRSPAVRPREAEIIDSGFENVESLLDDLQAFETWSRISLLALFQ
jgi:predicted NUDIX family phosphoesterase